MADPGSAAREESASATLPAKPDPAAPGRAEADRPRGPLGGTPPPAPPRSTPPPAPPSATAPTPPSGTYVNPPGSTPATEPSGTVPASSGGASSPGPRDSAPPPPSGTPEAPATTAPSAAPGHTAAPGHIPSAPPSGTTTPGGTAPPSGTTAPSTTAPPSSTAPSSGAPWWASVPAAPPPPVEPVPGLPPGWAEGGPVEGARRPPVPSGPPRDDGERRVANAPRSLRTPPVETPGPPLTAPDEQFGPAQTAPDERFGPAQTAPPEQFAPVPRPRTGHVGDGPPTYDAEPTALPGARPDGLDELVADTVLDGARYGAYVLRAGSSRGDSARYRGEPRRDALLTARFGTGESALVLVAVASGARTSDRAHLAAADACHWIGGAIGRSHLRLAEDIRAGRRGDLKSGLHRLTDRSYGLLRARAGELGMPPEEYTASLRCLLLSADPACRTRVFFGVGHGGLFRLRGGVWQDIEPVVPEPGAVPGAPVVGFGSAPAETPQGDRLTMDLNTVEPARPYIGPPAPPGEPFRFRASVARPGDTLLLCSAGLAEPLRGESALGKELAERWARPEPPGLAEYLADLQLRVKGYADDRTAVAVWEA
ncbi:protein phosphatase 2C domain-containing protein [Streptomyces sp. NPDC048361]|uniref:protein phosphatase 2C domain-containing protein n=1 Tax=Streptomyces sp. NPDC048361 TaxID=3154720 RepID=UPI003440D62A